MVYHGYLYRRVSEETSVESRKGPKPVFTKEEANAMAGWLSEMAKRRMGLTLGEFLDFVAKIVKEENRSTPFTDGRPSYEWSYAFMARNSHIVQSRKEVPLEYSRSKLTREKLERWYIGFRNFLTTEELLDKPERIWNADETGFNMGSKTGKVIGPSKAKTPSQVPHCTGGSSKDRLTVMFSCNADGQMMPPFMV